MTETKKVSTKPATLSVHHMYALYANRLLATGKYIGKRTAKYTWSIPNNAIFDKETGKEVMNYKLFKRVIALYNLYAGESLIKGYTLNLLNGLGNIFIARKERDPNIQSLNQHESRKLYAKLKEEGTLTKHNWKVFYTDNEFITTVWHKERKSLRNILFYKFVPAGGQPGKGFRAKVSKSIFANPMLKGLYPFIPHTSRMSAKEAREKFKEMNP